MTSQEGELENLVCSRPVVVLDFGSLVTKAGFCGEDTPTTFPTLVGLKDEDETPSKTSDLSEDTVNRTFSAGYEAQKNRSKLTLINPVKRGIVEDWDAMEKLFEFAFDEVLDVLPESTPVLIADSPRNTKENRERIVKLLFEKFRVESCYVAMDSVLSLFSSGRTTGITVESGEDLTSAVPIFEGYALRHSIEHLDVAGSALSNFLFHKLSSKSLELSRFDHMDLVWYFFFNTHIHTHTHTHTTHQVRQIKESFCEILLDFDGTKKKSMASFLKEYELPDGQVIAVSQRSCWECGEALFFPSTILGKSDSVMSRSSAYEGRGITEITTRALLHCDTELRQVLYEEIVPTGGTSMIPGFSKRLESEIRGLAPPSSQVCVNPDSQRKYAAWIGGSMMSSLTTFADMEISKQDFDDNEGKCVHQKCF